MIVILIAVKADAQNSLHGNVRCQGRPVEFAKIIINDAKQGTLSDTSGSFMISNMSLGKQIIIISAVGYSKQQREINITNGKNTLEIELEDDGMLGQVVISGTLKPVSKLDSPVPVEVYSAEFFKSNPVPSIFDALQNVNGVRPQLNCSVCSTGDIHINGLEGPYTMILIDGMPIVSGLSTVYGLGGIPQSLIERVEIVKGPASTLYGSEAVGGLINVITKKPQNAPLFSADIFSTSWAEVNADIAGKFNVGKKAQALFGANYYNYQLPIDNNNDGFTDVTQQHRISFFNKWNFDRLDNRIFSIAGRYVYEDRWGGDMNWAPEHRGGTEVYGESIFTSRWEFFGTYQLPVDEKILFQFSANGHDQNSVYGDLKYIADQRVGFGQLIWDRNFGKRHDFLAGAAMRYVFYDDNTPATATADTINPANLASHSFLPGVFVQDEIKLNENNTLLLGARYDYNSIHGSIFSPRINYKWNARNKRSVLRLSVGNGYRVANVFTEDHAALTGSREVIFLEELNPETSWNGNLNFVKKIVTKKGNFITVDLSSWYTYFDNKIIPDYDANPNQIIYGNLNGHAVSTGASLNMDFNFQSGLKILAGGTFMDVYSVQNGIKEQQEFAEKFTATWSISYEISKIGLKFHYTGNVYSPMELPLLGPLDPRSGTSPWFSIQNFQITKSFLNGIEIYGGAKNLLNWTPNKNNPFIIARSFDPFDKDVVFNSNGDVVATANNPYALTFDPAYVYGPNQGIRAFLGFRLSIK